MGEPETIGGEFEEPVADVPLDLRFEGIEGRSDTAREAEAEKETLRCGVGGDALRAGIDDIVLRALGVLDAMRAIEGMRVGTEADVGLACPVLEVVARFEAGAREVGDFVARDADAGEAFDGGFVEVGDGVVGGYVAGSVALAEGKDFGSEAAIVIDFEHVDGDVWSFEALDVVERFGPRCNSLAGETRNEIDVKVFDACVAERLDFALDDFGGVLAAGTGEFLRDERLHAETDAVDAGGSPGRGALERDVARGSFEGRFDEGRSGNRADESREIGGVHIAGSAATEVDGVGCESPLGVCDFAVERGEILWLKLAREDAGSEVTVGAFLRAEGIGNVDAGHLVYSVTGSPSCLATASDIISARVWPLRTNAPRASSQSNLKLLE